MPLPVGVLSGWHSSHEATFLVQAFSVVYWPLVQTLPSEQSESARHGEQSEPSPMHRCARG